MCVLILGCDARGRERCVGVCVEVCRGVQSGLCGVWNTHAPQQAADTVAVAGVRCAAKPSGDPSAQTMDRCRWRSGVCVCVCVHCGALLALWPTMVTMAPGAASGLVHTPKHEPVWQANQRPPEAHTWQPQAGRFTHMYVCVFNHQAARARQGSSVQALHSTAEHASLSAALAPLQ